MCGISGIINTSNKSVCDADIKSINDLIAHRGPDDEGFYFYKNFAFGHRRLAILDLSELGHQPMEYMEQYTITYNGEIYNYIEIKNELLQSGYSFKSNTDTEVILASYDKWGEDCVKRFNGMWAFALHDKEKEIIFCSRDRFGVKPFYYTKKDDKFIFGSEIKQLLHFFKDRFVNEKILADYLIIGYEEHTNETFFKNIYKLEQSHNLIYDLKTHTFTTHRYYDIMQDICRLDEEQSVQKYAEELTQSVKLRLRSDVKVGTCLSGGLDSSSIAALASKEYMLHTDKKFTAIHAKSTEKISDESSHAKEVAKSADLDLKIIEPSFEDFKKHIDEVVYTQEEPFGGASIFMQYFVMQKAKEIDCKVMLDGQGGDETLLGYERYYPAFLMSLNIFEKIKGFFSASENSKLTIKQLILYYIYFTNSKLRLARLKKKYAFVKKEFFEKISTVTVEKSSNCYLKIFELQKMEIFQTQMPHLLKYEDKNSMRNSIETRLPFIDYKTLQTAVSVNEKYKIKSGWTKYVLRKVVESILPKSIVWRKNKFGFEAPQKSWLSQLENEMKSKIENSQIIKHICQNVSFQTLDKTQKWRLYNTAKWEEIYSVKIS